MRNCFWALGIVFFIVFLVPSRVAFATTQSDVVVGLNTLFVLTAKYTQPVKIAIVFDPANSESVRDSGGILASFQEQFSQSALPKPKMAFSASLVPTTDLSLLAKNNVAFLARGLSLASFGAIKDAVRGKKILTMSVDLECVKVNACVLGIVSRPQVEIYYSQRAAERSAIRFYDIFTLLTLKIPDDPRFSPVM